jgi:cytochrome c
MLRVLRILPSLAMICLVCLAAVLIEGDPLRGKQLFNRCSGCHSVQGETMSGPPLDGVFGRKAAAIEGYRYSDALVNSGITWTDDVLDGYLSGPTKAVRGTRMSTSVTKPEDRADIIAYLKSLAVR